MKKLKRMKKKFKNLIMRNKCIIYRLEKFFNLLYTNLIQKMIKNFNYYNLVNFNKI